VLTPVVAAPHTPWTLLFDEHRCVGCGQCVGSCPTNALSGLRFAGRQPKIVVTWEDCTHCLLCLPWCPTAAFDKQRTPA
jgi:ferredoxin